MERGPLLQQFNTKRGCTGSSSTCFQNVFILIEKRVTEYSLGIYLTSLRFWLAFVK